MRERTRKYGNTNSAGSRTRSTPAHSTRVTFGIPLSSSSLPNRQACGKIARRAIQELPPEIRRQISTTVYESARRLQGALEQSPTRCPYCETSFGFFQTPNWEIKNDWALRRVGEKVYICRFTGDRWEQTGETDSCPNCGRNLLPDYEEPITIWPA